MKLSELVPHTSTWLGVPKATVDSVAKYLRPAGLISTGGRGPGGAEMTVDDKINLFLGVCGLEIASRAVDHVRIWRRLIRMPEPSAHEFMFLRSNTVRDFFFDLITKDLNGGELDAWLSAGSGHEITLDFFVDEFRFTIIVSRFSRSVDASDHSAEIIKVHFMQPPPYDPPFEQPRREEGYRAPSQLIRRLNATNLRGWGACLLESN